MMETMDELFQDEPVLAIPSLVDEYASKAPGDQDGPGQGDYCNH